MTPADRWPAVRAAVGALLAQAPETRAALLDRLCGDDAELRAEVVAQLEACERAASGDGFLDTPAAAFAAPLLADAETADVETALRAALADRYELVREAGRGGMATVWLARDLKHDRPVALKVLSPDLRAGMSPARFLREIRVTAGLTHPHILPLHESGEAAGLLYYVMPYVEGETLRERLARDGALPLADVLRLMREVAGALAYAHRQGVVHRDIKPANILLADGHAVVADFGIARAVGRAREPRERDARASLIDAEAATLTAEGTSLGTPAYMAPEQSSSGAEAADHRADLYALGVVAYEALAGAHPFGSRTPAGFIVAHRSELPPPLSERGRVPPGLAALVMQLLAKDPADRPQHAEDVVAALTTVPSSSRRRGRIVAGMAAAMVTLAAIGYAAWDASPAPAPSVAVLPFENTSRDPAEEPFSDGLTDELIGALGTIPGLRVSGRTSAFALKGKQLDARAVAETLGVGAVLEGSVRRSGGRVRVGVQLVSGSDGAVLWSDRYDRDAADVFAVQEEIVDAIVGALQVRFGDGAARQPGRSPVDTAAYELYLRGRYVFNARWGREGVLEALGYLEAAAARDPGYARAHAGISDAYTRLAVFGYAPPREVYPKAISAARRALAADSTLAEAHASLGHALLVSEFAWEEAERRLRRAIALDPNDSRARAWLGLCLSDQGRHAEAIAQLDTAVTLDPLSLPIANLRGRMYVRAGRPDEAIRTLRRVLELGPMMDLGHQQIGHAYLQKGMTTEAIAAFRQAAALNGPRDSAQLAYAYAVTGQRAEAERVLRDILHGAPPTGGSLPYHIAMAYAGLGYRDAAFGWLERGYAERTSFMNGVKGEPGLAALHDDPRWPALLRRMGLQP